jgi:WD40 repeat protein
MRLQLAAACFAVAALASCSDPASTIDEISGQPFEGKPAFSNDGSVLAIRIQSNTPGRSFDLALFNAVDPDVRSVLPFDGATFDGAALHSDGKHALSVEGDRICPYRERTPPQCTPSLGAKLGSALYSNDGRHVIAVPLEGALAVVFDAESLAEVRRLGNQSPSEPDAVRLGEPWQAGALGQNSKHLVIYGAELSADGSILLLREFGAASLRHVTANQIIRHFPDLLLNGNADLSADGSKLVVVTRDGTASIWNARTGDKIHSLPLQGQTPLDAVFTPNDAALIVAFKDCGAAEFDATTAKQTRSFSGSSFITVDEVDLAVAPNGARIAARCGRAVVRIWPF